RDEQGLAVALAQVQAELGGERRLARALEADQQDDGRLLRRRRQRRLAAAKHARQLLVDDADDLLRAGERLQHLGALGAFADGVDELPHHAEVDVRLQQRDTHLAQGLIEVLFRDGAVAGKAAEYALKS